MGPIVPILGMIVGFMMAENSIGDALFTKTQQKVLGLLFGKPDKSFYTNEIMRWAAMGRGTVSRELERLVGAGLISITREGNQNHYQADHTNPIYKELVSIVKKSFGIADEIKERLKPLDKSIELAFIYGSISKGSDTKSSDIDLMLVGKLELRPRFAGRWRRVWRLCRGCLRSPNLLPANLSGPCQAGTPDQDDREGTVVHLAGRCEG